MYRKHRVIDGRLPPIRATPAAQTRAVRRKAFHAGVPVVLLVGAAALGGCAAGGGANGLTALLSPQSDASSITTGSVATGSQGNAANKSVDIKNVIARARAAETDGRTAKALTILAKAHVKAPDNEELSAAYAKMAIEAGQGQVAFNVISRTAPEARLSGRMLSLRGAALASLGRHDEAHNAFTTALTRAPGDPDLLNNVAMSHVLRGELTAAERTLRRATSVTDNQKIRHNLALVLGLQGRFGEANKLKLASRANGEQTGAWNSSVKQMLGGPVPAKK